MNTSSISRDTAPAVSVIMINRNGGRYLRRAMASCRIAIESALPTEPRVEFLVVDNGSTDDPHPVIRNEMSNAAFDWRIVDEPRPGVNHARNAGIAAATADLLVFVDSDLEFDPKWLRAIIRAAEQNRSARVFAGRLEVGELEAPPPPWLAIDGPFARRSIVTRCNYGDRTLELPLTDDCGPVGPNMAFRRDVFTQFGTFDTRFGLRPGSLVPGAESEFFDRLARAGTRFLYVADAVVYHPLRASQMSRGYFRDRLRGVGRASSRVRRLRGEQPRAVCGLTLYMVRTLVSRSGRWLVACLRLAPPQERFYARGNVDIAVGFLQEDFAAWRDRRAGDATAADTRVEVA